MSELAPCAAGQRRRRGQVRSRSYDATGTPVASSRARARSSDAPSRSWVQPLKGEGWLAVVALLHAAAAPGLLVGPVEGFVPADTIVPPDTVIWLVLYVVVFGLFWHHHRLHWVPWLLRHQPLLCAVLLAAAASYFWSIAPEFTWKRATHLLGTTLIAVFVGYHFASRTLMSVLFYTLLILIVGSIVFALALPEIGQHFHRGSMVWKGLTGNKNTLGFIAAIATVFFTIGALFRRLPYKTAVCLALLSAVTLVMTRSATSVVVVVIGLSTVVIFAASKRIGAPSLLTLILVLAGGAAVGGYVGTGPQLHEFTELLGRDATFTNRTEVWAAAWQVTLERPWLGWGYGTLWWPTDETAFIPRQVMDTSWLAAHAHNGFLNVASELGLPAGFAAVGYVLAALWRTVRAYVTRASPCVLFTIAFVFMFLVENIPEAGILTGRESFWMLFVTSSITVARGLAPHAAPSLPRRGSRHPHRPDRGKERPQRRRRGTSSYAHHRGDLH